MEVDWLDTWRSSLYKFMKWTLNELRKTQMEQNTFYLNS